MWHVWGRGEVHLFGKPEEERSLEKPRRCWEGNIAMEMEIGGGNVDWTWLWIGRSGRLL
jgi:hypothetical protein